MALPWSNNFEGGIDGVTLTTSDLASGDPWNNITGTPQWSNAHPAHGSMGMKTVDPVAAMGPRWNAFGAISTNIYFRAYLWIPGYPVTNFFRPFMFSDIGGVPHAGFEVRPNGFARVHSGVGSLDGTITFPTNAIVRVELRGLANPGAGEVEARWWSSYDSFGPPTETILLIGQNNGTEISQMFIGSSNTFPTAPYTTYIDDCALSTTGWIGPAIPPSVLTVQVPAVSSIW
jgi:hypothetical protein